MTSFFNYCKQLIRDYLFSESAIISAGTVFETFYKLTDTICVRESGEGKLTKDLLYRWWDEIVLISGFQHDRYGEIVVNPLKDPEAYFNAILHESLMNIFEQFPDNDEFDSELDENFSTELLLLKLEEVVHFRPPFVLK